MNDQLFRKKSLEQIRSPEALDEYLHVIRPRTWVAFAAIAVFLVGFYLWCTFGYMDSVAKVAAYSYPEGEGNTILLFVKEEDASFVHAGTVYRINGKEFTVDTVAEEFIQVKSEDADPKDFEYCLHVGNLFLGEWIRYAYTDNTELPEGVYEAKLTLEHIHPLNFVFN